MKYCILKSKLIGLFDSDKLAAKPEEWGIYNEMELDVRRIGYATNLTPEIILRAKKMEVNFMLTHHDSWEFVFGMKEECNALLKEYHIIHAFFHAPLDDADFGTSASLAKALGIRNLKKDLPYAEIYNGGCIGELDTGMQFEEFSVKLTGILEEPVRQYKNHNKKIKKICVAAGGGNLTTEMKIAVEKGCDTYVTGEYALYSQQYARFAGMNLFVGSHTNTEISGVYAMAEKLVLGTDVEVYRIPESND
ncbi:Nif3-like dinuclear metal center hexameric protein [Robinsoniella sp. KNHs210]|uniref:Nif3-like dinuclear metal center hexameric protein n=1 Tax=Robinsoniella sp. KNHs210 TaxID=1469950 RepID=UPI000487D0C2|nr:Nif3-like dinuclear metal center hexameric protein [Robinsoniella sp. KNHs210]